MDPRYVPYAARSAPRYTSYPTAPHFSPGVGGAVLKGWLADLPPDTPLGLYLHIAYCREICWYCGCNTFAARRDETLDAYLDTLMREIELVASTLRSDRVETIRWGGGTPNILSPDRFERLFRHLEFWFDLDGLREHAIELDPRTLTQAQAELYAALGVTRASLGVQDFNAKVQHAIGRVQPVETVAEAVARLRTAGVPHVAMDLMYGLPHQDVAGVRASVRQAIAFAPDRIAVFGYAHVPWFKPRQRLIDAEALPGPTERFDSQAAAHEELVSAGYVPIGLDHYARPDDSLAVAARAGEVRRSFDGYVSAGSTALIGLGASAISTLPQGYAQSFSEVGAWRNAIEHDRLAAARGHALLDEDRRRARIIEQLLCDFSVDLADHGGADAFAEALAALAPLARDGLVEFDGARITIPQGARAFTRLVAEAFDAYRGRNGARHSGAV
jgi:oxygen-independent coproporphyrinogen-3 oxidase